MPRLGADRARHRRPEPSRVWYAELRGTNVVPTAARDREGRAFTRRRRGQIEPTLRGDQPGRRRAGVVRGGLLSTRRQRESDQGTATGSVRGSDELSCVCGEHVSGAVGGGGVRVGGAYPPDGVGGDGTGEGRGRHDSVASVPHRGSSGEERASVGSASGGEFRWARRVRYCGSEAAMPNRDER